MLTHARVGVRVRIVEIGHLGERVMMERMFRLVFF